MTNPAYKLAEADIGTLELAKGDNPKVLKYFADVGHSWVKHDETAWCAAFVGAMLKRAGMPHTGKLNARSYLNWGDEIPLADAQKGDIVVFWRGSKGGAEGHVGFYAGQIGDKILVLGGNQKNQVRIDTYPEDRLLGVRRAPGTSSPSAVLVKDGPARANVAQSKTVQASAVQIASGAGAGIAALSSLSGTAQIVALVFAGVVVAAAAWIMRERIKKWADGDR